MMNLPDELKAKLMEAQRAEEVAGLLREAGGDAALSERLWVELTHKRETDGKELSLDELAAVSGGECRDWAKQGCAATVEPGSWCWSDDKCALVSVLYEHSPLMNSRCVQCGSYVYKYIYKPSGYPFVKGQIYHVCTTCGHQEFIKYEGFED